MTRYLLTGLFAALVTTPVFSADFLTKTYTFKPHEPTHLHSFSPGARYLSCEAPNLNNPEVLRIYVQKKSITVNRESVCEKCAEDFLVSGNATITLKIEPFAQITVYNLGDTNLVMKCNR